MNKQSEAQTLINELLEASEAYYQGDGTSKLTDEEFDAKLSLLEEMSDDTNLSHLFEEGSPGWKLLENDVSLGTKPTTDNVVTHKSPMLSLGKAKTETELLSYLKKTKAAGAKSFMLQAKLDGFALSVTYKNGKITQLATRGTGTEGEDVSYIIKDPSVTTKGLPLTINLNKEVEVRGELFFTDEQFRNVDNTRYTLTGERFKNSRNSVVGLMKKAKQGVNYPVEFTFSVYSALIDGKPTDLTEIQDHGFITVTELTKSAASDTVITGLKTDKEVFDAVTKFGEARKNFTIPTDGVVVKPENDAEMLQKMGVTSHHPVSQIAYKYPGAYADTVIVDITTTVGKTGKLTPRAEVKPVDVSGVQITNLTMNNFNWVAEKDVRIGSKVRVHRANDVIPEIKLVLHNSEDTIKVQAPKECPNCETPLTYDKQESWPPKTLRCPNDECPSRDFFALKTAVMRSFLDIDGMSEVTLTTLNETGRVNSIADFYTLTLKELADSQLGVSNQGNPRRLGEKRAQNILDHIEKSKTLPLPRILVSLNITGLGQNTAKILTRQFKTIDRILELTADDLRNLEGFGDVKAEKNVRGFALRRGLIGRLRSLGVQFGEGTNPTTNTTIAKLSGISFAISGNVPAPFANRNELIEYIETNGGEFHSGPKATTSFVIGDPTSTSSKTVKALKLGLSFLSPEEFTQTYTD
jgi:DNA ligase (NAD+)